MSTSENKHETIKVTYEPFKEVVIKEFTQFEKIEDLIYMLAQLRAAGAPVALNWANGVIFLNNSLPLENDQIIDDFLKGKVYWANVSFAIMPQYKQVVETKEKIQVPVINASSNTILRQVTEWLKQQK